VSTYGGATLADRTAGDPWAALGDPSRRRILRLLASRPASVAELAEGLPISRPAVSQHLKVLKDSGLVVVQPQGTRRIYRVDPAGLAALRAELDSFWGTALANFAQLAAQHGAAEPSSKETNR
jgi:DNA-binding transcriptional ArsR family regulator